jgi:hypothetical protein
MMVANKSRRDDGEFAPKSGSCTDANLQGGRECRDCCPGDRRLLRPGQLSHACRRLTQSITPNRAGGDHLSLDPEFEHTLECPHSRSAPALRPLVSLQSGIHVSGFDLRTGLGTITVVKGFWLSPLSLHFSLSPPQKNSPAGHNRSRRAFGLGRYRFWPFPWDSQDRSPLPQL